MELEQKIYRGNIILAILWGCAYAYILPFSTWLVFDVAGFTPDSQSASALEFFIYDTVKILMLLIALIYGIAWIRASLNVERVRDYLAGKGKGGGYFLGAMFGSVTPFLFLLQYSYFSWFRYGKDSFWNNNVFPHHITTHK